MRKLSFISLLIATLLLGIVGFAMAANQNPDSQNYVILNGPGGPEGVTPVTEVVRVRWSYQDKNAQAAETIASGDVLVWDTNSADGYTVSQCVTDAQAASSYAGVAVTTFQSATDNSIRAGGRNVGYMAVRGYALAKVDTSGSTTAGTLVPNGATLEAAFGTKGTTTAGNGSGSPDCGVLLRDDASDGIMPVWLK